MLLLEANIREEQIMDRQRGLEDSINTLMEMIKAWQKRLTYSRIDINMDMQKKNDDIVKRLSHLKSDVEKKFNIDKEDIQILGTRQSQDMEKTGSINPFSQD